MSLLRQGKAQCLSIYIGESDQWQGTPLYVAIVQLLREHGCAGATVTRAIAGDGAGARLHESGGWRWSSDAPIIVQIIDQPARLQRLLPQLQEMLTGGLITLHEVEILKYSHARQRGLPTKLSVQQVMQSSITSVAPDTPVATIIDLLLAAPFRALPVVDEQQRLRGIISTGDLIKAGALPMRRGLVRTALELDSFTAETIEGTLRQARQSLHTAQDVMNRQVRTIRPTTSIRDAAQIMLETGLRRLPVVEIDGMFIGMVSRADLLQAIVTSPLMSPQTSSATQPLQPPPLQADIPAQERPVTDYVNADVSTVDEQTPLSEVIDALILAPLKRVIVVNAQGQVRGIISDVDVLSRLHADVRPGFLTTLAGWALGRTGRLSTGILTATPGQARVAADIMNREVVTISQATSVQVAIERMLTTRRKVLPVVNAQGLLVGVVGRSDLLRILLEG